MNFLHLFPKLAAKSKYYKDFYEVASNLYFKACRYGYTSVVKYLITLRGIIEATDADEKNGLQIAAENNHDDICKLLIESSNGSQLSFSNDVDENSPLCTIEPMKIDDCT